MISCPLYEEIVSRCDAIIEENGGTLPVLSKEDLSRLGQLINRSTPEEQLDIQVIYGCYRASELEGNRRVKNVQEEACKKVPYNGKVQSLGKGIQFFLRKLPETLCYYLHIYIDHLYNRKK